MTRIEAVVLKPLIRQVRDSLLSSTAPVGKISVSEFGNDTSRSMLSVIVPDGEVEQVFKAVVHSVGVIQSGRSQIFIRKLDDPPTDEGPRGPG